MLIKCVLAIWINQFISFSGLLALLFQWQAIEKRHAHFIKWIPNAPMTRSCSTKSLCKIFFSICWKSSTQWFMHGRAARPFCANWEATRYLTKMINWLKKYISRTTRFLHYAENMIYQSVSLKLGYLVTEWPDTRIGSGKEYN